MLIFLNTSDLKDAVGLSSSICLKVVFEQTQFSWHWASKMDEKKHEFW